jgi:RNA polymerase sigma-70 factor, ECF subfamily
MTAYASQGQRFEMTDGADRLYERVLVLRCQTGDADAFTEIVERYQRRLRYYLCKMLGESHAAEDIFQEVWIDVFRAIPRLVDAGAFRAWLYRIARDRAIRELRKRRPTPSPAETFDLIESEAKNEIVMFEDTEQFHAALDHLSPDHREALILLFVEDMTYQEIADATGLQIGTVRSRIHYAKRVLRDVLERMNTHE